MNTPTDADNESPRGQDSDFRIPIVEEVAAIGKRVVESGKVRIHRRAVERTDFVEQTLRHDAVSIDRVAVDRVVAEVPGVREEEGVVIIPVVEERIRIVHELVVIEEIRITKNVEAVPVRVPVTTISTEVEIERVDGTA